MTALKAVEEYVDNRRSLRQSGYRNGRIQTVYLQMTERYGQVVTPTMTLKPYDDDEGFNDRWWSDHPVNPDRLRWFSFRDAAPAGILADPPVRSSRRLSAPWLRPSCGRASHGYSPRRPDECILRRRRRVLGGLGWCSHVRQRDDPSPRCQLFFISPH